jgi:hypothetical protein
MTISSKLVELAEKGSRVDSTITPHMRVGKDIVIDVREIAKS